jgi:hypothetical protein
LVLRHRCQQAVTHRVHGESAALLLEARCSLHAFKVSCNSLLMG